MLTRAALLLALGVVLVPRTATADFHLPHFNLTAMEAALPVAVAGDAAAQDCSAAAPGVHGASFDGGPLVFETVQLSGRERVSFAQNRNDTGGACEPALRLVPAAPSQTGAAWHVTPQKVETGFTTRFRFRLHRKSERCESLTQLNDLLTEHYELCSSDLGGDGAGGAGHGFAFVVQAADARWGAVGPVPDPGPGYSGIPSSVAVEFDTRGPAAHVSVHAGGDPSEAGELAGAAAGPLEALADAEEGVHEAWVALHEGVRTDLAAAGHFSASPAAAALLTARTQTLCVHLDDAATPLLCVPLDVTAALDLAGGAALVGFTAANGGGGWAAHDVLEWSFCEGGGCVPA